MTSIKSNIYNKELPLKSLNKRKKNIDLNNHVNLNTVNVLSLFSGCGGMDLGFEGGFEVPERCINKKINADQIDFIDEKGYVHLKKTRFKTIFANDILKEAKLTWIHNFSKKKSNSNSFHPESIVDLVKRHKNGESIFPQNIDVVTGGFPCQDFSIAGKRKGFISHKNHLGKIENDIPNIETRGQLYIWMKEVIEITKPKVFIAENVKGLVNLENVKEIIQKDFSEIGGNGYLVFNPIVLHAADYGVSQNRERVFFIGIKKSALNKYILSNLISDQITKELFPYPPKTHSFTCKNENLEPFVKLKEILSGLGEPENSKDWSHKFYSKAKYMGKHCQGQREIDLEYISPTIRAEHHGNIEFRRLSTINGGKNLTELKKGMVERRLSIRECALIQTFPRDFEFVIPNNDGRPGFLVSPSSAYKVIGNAVPPLLAFNIAFRLDKLWDIYFDE